ncbi:MAG: DUF1893 domain-containing protein [Candidatus Marinimicrobia bacterium]|nr:DUF1893 domain-containing protein [Candidatus Neomarinimicrobiota bacterium]MDD5709442.1 DUF1893 domain-containing protein [Candidatus Neomarinimicrobiota bacterium]
MKNTDLNMARELLEKGNDTFVAVKNGNILYRSQRRGIQPYFDALNACGESLRDCSLADRVAGKAALHLALYISAAALYTPLASRHAAALADTFLFHFEYEDLVPHIVNRKGDFMCPMEEAVLDIGNPGEAFIKLQETLRILQKV